MTTEEKIQKILLEALYKDTNCWAETVTEIAALIEPYKKLVEAQDELINYIFMRVESDKTPKSAKQYLNHIHKLRAKIEQLKKELK